MREIFPRAFIKGSTYAVAGASMAGASWAHASSARERLRLSVSPGVIGVRAKQKELLHYVIKHGFAAMIS